MLKQLNYPFDASLIQKMKRSFKKELLNQNVVRIKKRIAVLGGSTTNEIVDMLELFLLNHDIEPIFYQSEFNKFYEDIIFNNGELINFKPEIIFFHVTNKNLVFKPEMRDSVESINEKLESDFSRFANLIEKAQNVYKCSIIINNMDWPFYRLLGNKDTYDFRGFGNYVLNFNRLLNNFVNNHKNVYVNDLMYMQSRHGIDEFSNPSYWYMYKYAIAVPFIPYFSFNLSNIIKSIYGKNKKALVLDLDNTLWGGIIGDDGVKGIQIGHETSLGEAYSEFQEYIKKHKDLGIVLTINSKNEHDNALKGLNHPEGTLKPDDFIVIKANWNPKSLNLKQIASELNVGEDSLVFVDDNPAEREIVLQQVSAASVPNIKDVTDYITILDHSSFFEIINFSDDDLKRNEMYKLNLQRANLEASFDNYDEYLDSLEMKALIKNFDSIYIQRIAQLTNKSNQFNLTTKRFTEAEMTEASCDSKRICLFGKLIDRFGDNGVVTVVIGKEETQDILGIELWLMSCRVLKRGMEDAMLDEFVRLSREKHYKILRGYYYPSEKNGMVKEFYKNFGFAKIDENENGNTCWELEINDYQNKNKHIEMEKNDD